MYGSSSSTDVDDVVVDVFEAVIIVVGTNSVMDNTICCNVEYKCIISGKMAWMSSFLLL